MRTFVLTFVLFLTGCVSAPTQQEMSSADYGPPPTSYRSTIKDYLSQTLKDPYTADIQYLFEPRKDWTGLGGNKQFGYAVCARVNSKNSFGAYTGFKLAYFLIRNDQVVASTGLGSGQLENVGAQQQCNPDKSAP